MTATAERTKHQPRSWEFDHWSDEMKQQWQARSPGDYDPPMFDTGKRRWRLPTRILASVCANSSVLRDVTWEQSMESGRNYLVGDKVPMDEFILRHRSPLSHWQKQAYAWAKANPCFKVYFKTPGHEWEVYVLGDHVIFALPHQDAGGEKHYASRDGKTKVLINLD